MDDTKHEQPPEEFEVEITELPEEPVADKSTQSAINRPLRRMKWLFGRQPSMQRGKWLFQRQLSPRQRALQLGATISAVALVALIILGSSNNVRDALVVGFSGHAPSAPPTPTATLFPGLDLFYISGIPSWSKVSIDGHTLAQVPSIGIDPPIRLTRGLHKVEWRAEPFQLQSCTVSVPPVFMNNTCSVKATVRLEQGLSAWVIAFSVSLAMLPDLQRNALTQAAQTALDSLQSTETVQPGELYVDNHSSRLPIVALQPLHATLNFQLDTNPASSVPCSNQLFVGVQSCLDCRLFCSVPNQVEPSSNPGTHEQTWNVYALIYAVWKYTTLGGQVIAQNQPDTAFEDESPAKEHIIELHILWDGIGWYVTALSNNPNFPTIGSPECASAQDEIGVTGVYSSSAVGLVTWQYIPGPDPAAGCLAVGTPDDTSLPAGYLLHRFGVIVAANDAARRYWSMTPSGDAYEQRLAEQLAKLPPLS